VQKKSNTSQFKAYFKIMEKNIDDKAKAFLKKFKALKALKEIVVEKGC
jgi:hypothetical protein